MSANVSKGAAIPEPAAAAAFGHGAPGRSRPAKAMRAVAVVLILAGALALADAVVTLLWQEPISWLYATLRQDHLEGALHKVEETPPTPIETRDLASIRDERSRIAFLARALQARTGDGGAVGRIVIPRIGANFVVVKGTDTEDLKSGPGIYSETGFPGTDATTAIAGHRTTYLAPFRHIDSLPPGSWISLDMPYAQLRYQVIGSRVVQPTDVQAAVGDAGYSRLVLSACTPLFTAEKRLLVYARLVYEEPRGSARDLPGGALPHSIDVLRPQPHRSLPPVLIPLDPRNGAPLV
ncbi:MAG TPA: class E sortase [Solirubrobacteraceae bacterium]|jgi:sortase A|nr:class E sortase [Solirubrobacteraceae bacterium]